MQRRDTTFLIVFMAAALSFIQAESLAIETSPSEAANRAAEDGLKIFRKLVTEKNAGGMGFESLGEASQMRLGNNHDPRMTPMKVFLVGFEALKQYRPGSDPEKLLVDMHRFIYPVTVDKEVRSSLTVAEIKDNKGWKTTEYGSPELVKLLLKNRKVKSDFVVWVPRLYLHFIGTRKGSEIWLTSIVSLRRYEFVAGKFLPAGDVFDRLQKETKSVQGRLK